MAAVTINRRRSAVFGNKRVIMADISIAANGDTFDTKLKIIDSASVDSSTTGAIGATKAAGVLTFATGGAIANALVVAFGN
jgi:hypothetical protein